MSHAYFSFDFLFRFGWAHNWILKHSPRWTTLGSSTVVRPQNAFSTPFQPWSFQWTLTLFRKRGWRKEEEEFFNTLDEKHGVFMLSEPKWGWGGGREWGVGPNTKSDKKLSMYYKQMHWFNNITWKRVITVTCSAEKWKSVCCHSPSPFDGPVATERTPTGRPTSVHQICTVSLISHHGGSGGGALRFPTSNYLLFIGRFRAFFEGGKTRWGVMVSGEGQFCSFHELASGEHAPCTYPKNIVFFPCKLQLEFTILECESCWLFC